MAHHWSDPQENQMSKDEFKKLFTKGDEPGATGKYPDGKLDPLDEGELQMRLGNIQGRIVIEFGKPITSIGFTKDEALALGQALIDRALNINNV